MMVLKFLEILRKIGSLSKGVNFTTSWPHQYDYSISLILTDAHPGLLKTLKRLDSLLERHPWQEQQWLQVAAVENNPRKTNLPYFLFLRLLHILKLFSFLD